MYKPEGIIHITGEPDVGKTLLALSAYHPEKTAYLFDDVKRPPIDKDEFGLFIDLVGQYSSLRLLEFYTAIKDKIDDIPDRKYDAIIFDTWAKVGKSVRYYAKAHPYEFREQSTFAPSGTIANMEKWSEAHNVEAAFISKLSRKAKALFLITHIKEKIVAGARSGLMQPDCGKSFSKVCNLRLWLRHNEKSGVPIALVLKRLSRANLDKGGLEVVNVLPRRIKPLDSDISLWQTIDRYWSEPFGNREPTEDEKPTEYELSILDGILTKDQKEVWHAELAERKRKEKEEEELFQLNYEEVLAKVQEIKHLPPPIILKEIKQNYNGYELNDVTKMLKELE